LPPEASVAVAEDGTFSSPPVPAGPVVASLHCPDQTIPSIGGSSSSEGGQMELGKFDLAAGVDTHKDFDLRAAFPGSVLLRITVNGKPGVGLIASLSREGGAGAVGVADASGSCRIGPALSDAYRVCVRPVDNAWVYVDPRTITVNAGPVQTIAVDVVLFDGTVVVKDAATHQPLANGSIGIAPDPNPTWANVMARTDGDGHMHLSLPAGRWRISHSGEFFFANDSKPGVFVDWGSQGASAKEVELETAAK
jgi:hypothetical protein